MVERIVIVGAGSTGDLLAVRLSAVAPVVLTDTSREALERMEVEPSPRTGGRGAPAHEHRITFHQGDATSRLVQESLRGALGEAVALIAATGCDRTNFEICRIALALGFEPVVGIAIDAGCVDEYRALGARVIERASLLVAAAERELRYGGLTVASNVGLGAGDVIQTRVMSSSSAVGVTVGDLRADRWHVAGVYRRGELILPRPDTTIDADDLLLLVGDPEILPSVAENLHIGTPQFPRRTGPRVVAYMPTGPDERLEREARSLLWATRATGLVRVFPEAKATELTPTRAPQGQHGVPAKALGDAPVRGTTLAEHAAGLSALQPGVVVASNPPRTLLTRLWGGTEALGHLANQLKAPVLVPRGATTYSQIVYVVGTGRNEVATAEVAIDLARQFAVPLMVVLTTLPPSLSSAGADGTTMLGMAERRARLYRIPMTLHRLQGNPLRTTLEVLRPGDLVVVSRSRSVRDSFTAPDVALRLARLAPCSTLIFTH